MRFGLVLVTFFTSGLAFGIWPFTVRFPTSGTYYALDEAAVRSGASLEQSTLVLSLERQAINVTSHIRTASGYVPMTVRYNEQWIFTDEELRKSPIRKLPAGCKAIKQS